MARKKSEEFVAEDPVAEVVTEPVLLAYKVCPVCGSRIYAVMPREVCEECDVPYELEE